MPAVSLRRVANLPAPVVNLVRLLVVLSAAFVLHADPVIVYSKYFKGSKPENVIITVTKSGDTEYKEAANDDQPIKFKLTEAQTAEIFSLSDKLGHFSKPLESPAKVAHMGWKTFHYEDGADKHEVKFNYSENLDAQALQDWFERITETEQDFIDLDRTVHFDKLGVNQSILMVEITYDRKRLIAPEQFLPLLDRVAKNESYIHMARERAANLAEMFRNNKTAQAGPQ
ncbi:MAG TPA: hypothetical protein VKU01_06150 [Bryobacteraceae bacterium]|nr:hypothetical protein [Bryobacteraceae bacterium]